MEPLDKVALFNIKYGTSFAVLFARESLGESVSLGRLVDPNTLVEDLERYNAPLLANLHDGVLLSD